MKKILLTTLLAVLAGVTQLRADTDIYITGSTAFRVNVIAAVQNMFSSITVGYADTAQVAGGTTDSYASGKNYVWTISGTPITALTNITGTLTVHANFTGSVQGIKAVQNEFSTKFTFLDKSGTDTTAHVITNSSTIAFSDVFATSTAYPEPSGFGEDTVAIQPFVFVKSESPTVSGITNITWQEAKALISLGSLPLSFWTQNGGSTNVYMINRTRDSGTRRTVLGEVDDKYAQPFPINIYYPSVMAFTNYNSTVTGTTNNVVGASLGNLVNNLQWGPGYVGGGDIKSELAIADVQNAAVSYLSFSDAKGISGVNWNYVLSDNGNWPTLAGAGVHGQTTGTNDFTPILTGQYSYWAEEVVDYPTASGSLNTADQDVSLTQLGTGTTPGTFLGVLNYQSYGTNSVLLGSIEREIINSGTSAVGNTAIPIWQMKVNHNGIGGVIAPGHY